MKANCSCDLGAKDFLKKAFTESSTAWCTPRTLGKVSKMVAMLDTAAWMGRGISCSLLRCPRSSAMKLIYRSHWAIEALGAGSTVPTGQFLHSFSYLLMLQGIYIV